MATPTFGEFDDSKEDWLSYTERMQQYFVANAVEEDRQRAMLLSTCGPPTYQLMKDLVAPEKPTQKTFKELVELVEAHKNPQPSIIVRRFHFHSRAQSETETIPQYVAILRRLSKHCNFGDTLGDMLRDRLVCGLRDTGLQRRLLAVMHPHMGSGLFSLNHRKRVSS
jgi:hypothetical protein